MLLLLCVVVEGPLREIGWAFSFASLHPLEERPRGTRTSQGELDAPLYPRSLARASPSTLATQPRKGRPPDAKPRTYTPIIEDRIEAKSVILRKAVTGN